MLKHFTLEISIIKSHQTEQIIKVASSFQIPELNCVSLKWIVFIKLLQLQKGLTWNYSLGRDLRNCFILLRTWCNKFKVCIIWLHAVDAFSSLPLIHSCRLSELCMHWEPSPVPIDFVRRITESISPSSWHACSWVTPNAMFGMRDLCKT